MLSQQQIDQAAELLVRSRQRLQQIETLPDDCCPQTAADAYAIQDRVAERLWAELGGVGAWKVGAVDPTAEPIVAPIGRPLLFESGVTLPATDFHMLGIEAELAFKLGSDLPPKNGGYQRAQVERAIASVHPAIEIVDTRLKHWEVADPWWKLADNQLDGGLVVGPGSADWKQIKPLEQAAALVVDGKRLVETVGGNIAGDLVRLVVWLANHCSERCGGLKAGDIVTTGTFTGLVFVEPDAKVTAEFPGVGQAWVRFSA